MEQNLGYFLSTNSCWLSSNWRKLNIQSSFFKYFVISFVEPNNFYSTVKSSVIESGMVMPRLPASYPAGIEQKNFKTKLRHTKFLNFCFPTTQNSRMRGTWVSLPRAPTLAHVHIQMFAIAMGNLIMEIWLGGNIRGGLLREINRGFTVNGR